MNYFRYFSIALTILLVVGMFGCKASEPSTTDPESDRPVDEREELTSEFIALLDNTRSNLSDVYLSQKQDIPEIYLKSDGKEQRINRNPYDGFRVQILSTRNVEQADSVANSFRMWADSTIAGYAADAYVSFQQPHYRVHVGDFQQREQANNFSRLIKSKYPDAWVVHDRIEPSEVPTDTATFEFQQPKPVTADSLDNESDL